MGVSQISNELQEEAVAASSLPTLLTTESATTESESARVKAGKWDSHKKRLKARQREQKQEGIASILSKVVLEDRVENTTARSVLQGLKNEGDNDTKDDSNVSDTTAEAGASGSTSTQNSVTPNSSNTLETLFRPIPGLEELLLGKNAASTNDSDSSSSHADSGNNASSGSSFFWSRVPDDCTPHRCELSRDTASAGLLAGEEKRQQRYKKKLLKKLSDGDISQERMEEMLASFGRVDRKEETNSPKNGKENANDKSSSVFSLMSQNRGERKRQQIENFVSLLLMFFQHPNLKWLEEHKEHLKNQSSSSLQNINERNARPLRRVVDFGCGSGNLCLALAAFFRETEFVFIDRNAESLKILRNRAQLAGLTNVRVVCMNFAFDNLEAFDIDLVLEEEERANSNSSDRVLEEGVTSGTGEGNESESANSSLSRVTGFDLGIGLHCCGGFTDMVMELCAAAGADCVICPCCNGKMGNDVGKGKKSNNEKGNSEKDKANVKSKQDGNGASENSSGNGDTNPKDTKDYAGSGDVTGNKDDVFTYPRSTFVSNQITEDEYLQVACVADGTNADNPAMREKRKKEMGDATNERKCGSPYSCKCLIEVDRALWACEQKKLGGWRMPMRGLMAMRTAGGSDVDVCGEVGGGAGNNLEDSDSEEREGSRRNREKDRESKTESGEEDRKEDRNEPSALEDSLKQQGVHLLKLAPVNGVEDPW